MRQGVSDSVYGLRMADTPEALAWIGSAVRKRRVDLGLSQAQLANVLTTAMGMPMDQPAIAALEAGKRQVGVVELMVFAAALRCTLNGLLYGPVAEGEWITVGTPPIHPTYVSLGNLKINTYALGEVLEGGWTEDTAHAWSLSSEAGQGIVDPVAVWEAIELLTLDPEAEMLIEAQVCTREQLANVLPRAAEMVTTALPPAGGWTVTKLLNHLVDARIAEIPDGVTERGRRTIASAQRRRITECLKEVL